MSKQEQLSPCEKVCAEHAALEKKIENLEKALHNNEFCSKLTKPELALLQAQLAAMQEYYSCLTARLAIWRDV